MALELMGHVAIPYKWKEFLFHSGCSLTRSNQFGDNPDEEVPSDDPYQNREKYTITSSGKLLRTPSTGSI